MGADARLGGRVGPDALQAILDLVPSAWLGAAGDGPYVEALAARLEAPRTWAQEAQDARS